MGRLPVEGLMGPVVVIVAEPGGDGCANLVGALQSSLSGLGARSIYLKADPDASKKLGHVQEELFSGGGRFVEQVE